MISVVLREIGIALAFFAIPLWALGVHWEAFATGAALVALDAYMAHKRGQRAREAMDVLLMGSDQLRVAASPALQVIDDGGETTRHRRPNPGRQHTPMQAG
jgi:hypothetical protein